MMLPEFKEAEMVKLLIKGEVVACHGMWRDGKDVVAVLEGASHSAFDDIEAEFIGVSHIQHEDDPDEVVFYDRYKIDPKLFV